MVFSYILLGEAHAILAMSITWEGKLRFLLLTEALEFLLTSAHKFVSVGRFLSILHAGEPGVPGTEPLYLRELLLT